MDENLKKQVDEDIEGAQKMIGQAQSRLDADFNPSKQDKKQPLPPPCDLWKELGDLFDRLENILDTLRDGGYE